MPSRYDSRTGWNRAKAEEYYRRANRQPPAPPPSRRPEPTSEEVGPPPPSRRPEPRSEELLPPYYPDDPQTPSPTSPYDLLGRMRQPSRLPSDKSVSPYDNPWSGNPYNNPWIRRILPLPYDNPKPSPPTLPSYNPLSGNTIRGFEEYPTLPSDIEDAKIYEEQPLDRPIYEEQPLDRPYGPPPPWAGRGGGPPGGGSSFTDTPPTTTASQMQMPRMDPRAMAELAALMQRTMGAAPAPTQQMPSAWPIRPQRR